MSNNKKIVNEGLRTGDLQDLLYPIFEVDTFRSKMGEDKDVCVLTFQAKDRSPARDFMEFIEKGYGFVLDADVSAGENMKGEYSIFVEIERSPKIIENITELLFGATKLTGIEDWGFKYYKEKKPTRATTENLKDKIPSSSKIYEQVLQKYKTNEVKEFFNKTLMDDLVLENDIITIKKPFNVEVKLKLVQEGENNKILETIDLAPSVGQDAMAEIFWLTKVMGDYNIGKFGDNNFVFTNGSKSMILQRIK